MGQARTYQVFAARTKKGQPRLIHRNIKGQKDAKEKAKKYHEEHPDRYVGVFELSRVKVHKPKKK